MKTLDAFVLINGIDQTLNALKQQSQQISSLEKQINHIISLDGALKGEAGQAIRAFYTECHIPFLQFFQVVIEEYSAALKNTKQALHALESNEHGFISQAFIEHDLDQGLKKAERTISEIVSEVNHAIGRVGHIVHLPNVDESAFQQNYQKAWLETSKTIGLLHAFDREQTSALHETKSSLQTMKQYIDTLSPMFTGPKIDITSYQKGSIFKDEKEEKVSSTISGLKDKIDNPKDNPMMIMLKKLKEKQHANVETVVRETPSSKINQTTLTLNGKVYNINEYKKINFEHAKTVDVMRDGMLYRLRISEKNKVTIESVKPISDVKTGDQPQNILNTAVEFTGINDAIRVITGRDPITGDKVADMDRLVSGVYMVPSTNIVKVGKYVFKIIKGEKVAKKVEKKVKGIGRGEQLLDKVKTYEQARNKTVDIVGDLGPNSQPYTGTLKSSAGYGKVVGRQSADGKVRWRLDYDPKKGPHINIEDFRNGKGANARKIAIPFEGNESTFKSLLKHLNR
ncbi:T7SS effector LXG polymorphic toxin [Bacillus sp. FSL L8-0167]|uniref:T7SS effector LXG polymorphic toxin n=1 Tax=Bacillus TaxID=1386 RepID=UPI0009BA5BD1|nr:T7SS effector LXG polymorphic toxin [Bacillus safensis]MCM3450335.1 T7SS effector LXG polymorphic toxin [Bacillus safensis]MDR6682122.1 putative ribonuclease toxin of YeeF-YezG toxin-antitoxin module [Bacillus safensis]MEC0948317.1 T7SS effector LXG polymorphic toxin [Bacillus safensis]MED5091898.1 T7SS effector LXG polymorphic toxin [Bacillus safensis]